MRSSAVTALKSASHEPQSRSIASLVRSVVVSGPGVRRMRSRSIGWSPSSICAWSQRSRLLVAATPACGGRPTTPSAMNSSVATVDAGGDQHRHRRRGADLAGLVEVEDGDRGDLGLGRVEEHHRRDRRHRVDEEVARDVHQRRRADRQRDAPEGLVERHLQRRADTASNSASSAFSAVTAVRWPVV